MTWTYLATAAAGAAVVATSGGNVLLVALVDVAAVIAIVAGIKIHRLPAWPCWGPIAVALAAWTVAMVWLSLLGPVRAPDDVPLALNVLFLAPFAGLGGGILALLRRQRETIAPPLVDVAMLVIVAQLVASEFGLGPQLLPELIVVALAVRLLLGSTQPASG